MQGFKTKAAFRIETGAYGTPISCNTAGYQIPFISENIALANEYGNSIQLRGLAGVKDNFQMAKKYSGDLTVELTYESCLYLLAAALGMSHQDESPETTNGYLHNLDPSSDLSTRDWNGFEERNPTNTRRARGTLCFEKDTSVWEYTSCMVNSLTIEAAPDRVKATLGVVANKFDQDSATNGDSGSYSFSSNDEDVVWSDLTIYVKPVDEFTIGSSNDVLQFDDGATWSIDIPDDTYTGYELAQEVEDLMNAEATAAQDYIVHYLPNERRFEIKAKGTTSFEITTTGDANETLGFKGTAAQTSVNGMIKSAFMAQTDGFTAWADADKLGVNKITFNLQNNLAVDDQDTESDLYILEPERNDFRIITGTLEIPRYQNDEFLKAVSGFDNYEIKIQFQGSLIGGSDYNEININLPSVKFTSGTAPATGPELIKQTLNFEAQIPPHIDILNHYNQDTDLVISDSTPSSEQVRTLELYDDAIYAGCANGVILKWDPDTGDWSTSCDLGAFIVVSMEVYTPENKLFAGGNDGSISEYDGSSWSTSTDTGNDTIVDMIEYNGNLYALELETGKIFEYNGTSWSTSCDTPLTNATHLEVYDGKLFMIGDNGTNTICYEYNGTSWSTSCDFGAVTFDRHALCVHGGRLFANSDGDLYAHDGTSWASAGSLGSTYAPGFMISWKGLLVIFPENTGDVYYYSFSGDTLVKFEDNLPSAYSRPKILFGDRLFAPVSTSYLTWIEPRQEVRIEIQNQISTNPL